MTKELVLSITKKDLVVQTFKGSGPGGQHRNKVMTAVRIIHPESGAVGESQSEKSQWQNKKLALQHLVDSPRFQAWLRIRHAELRTGKTIDQIVDEQMEEKNLKFEGKDDRGRWVPIEESMEE